jgi:hypothetical protein
VAGAQFLEQVETNTFEQKAKMGMVEHAMRQVHVKSPGLEIC